MVQTFRFPPAFLSRPADAGHPPPGGGDFFAPLGRWNGYFRSDNLQHQLVNDFVEIDKPAFFGQLTLTIPVSFDILYLGKFN